MLTNFSGTARLSGCKNSSLTSPHRRSRKHPKKSPNAPRSASPILQATILRNARNRGLPKSTERKLSSPSHLPYPVRHPRGTPAPRHLRILSHLLLRGHLKSLSSLDRNRRNQTCSRVVYVSHRARMGCCACTTRLYGGLRQIVVQARREMGCGWHTRNARTLSRRRG